MGAHTMQSRRPTGTEFPAARVTLAKSAVPCRTEDVNLVKERECEGYSCVLFLGIYLSFAGRRKLLRVTCAVKLQQLPLMPFKNVQEGLRWMS